MATLKFQNIGDLKVYSPRDRGELMEMAVREKRMLIAMNAEKIVCADGRLKELVSQNIGYPDGIGVVLALYLKGVARPLKVPGCELWLDFVRTYSGRKSFYLIGGASEVIEKTVAKLKRQFPAIDIKGYRNGFLESDDDRLEVIRDVAKKKTRYCVRRYGVTQAGKSDG